MTIYSRKNKLFSYWFFIFPWTFCVALTLRLCHPRPRIIEGVTATTEQVHFFSKITFLLISKMHRLIVVNVVQKQSTSNR